MPAFMKEQMRREAVSMMTAAIRGKLLGEVPIERPSVRSIFFLNSSALV